MVTANRLYPLVSASEYLDTDWVTKLQSLANMIDADITALINQLDTDATLAANSNSKVPSQAAIKSYVDNLVTGVSWKTAVRAATTANITLSGAQTIDGVSVVAGNRVLVKNQSTASQNGIYVAATGSWARAADADTGAELVNATCLVSEGTVNADTQWTCTTNSAITVGSTSVAFAQLGGAGTYTATGGVVLTGNQFSADTGTSGHKLPWLDGANIFSDTQTLRKASGGFQFLIDNGANNKQLASWWSSSDDQWNLQPRNGGSLVGNTALSYNFTSGIWSVASPLTVAGQLIGKGTATNDNAAAGYIGEQPSAATALDAVTLSGATSTNVVSLTLQPGDYDVYADALYYADATTRISRLFSSLSFTSATLDQTDYGRFSDQMYPATFVPTNNGRITQKVGPMRVSIATATTIYLVAYCTFDTAGLKVGGRIYTRRRR